MVTTQSGETQDENCSVDTILLQIEPRIVALAKRIVYTGLADWECDEIVQLVWIKLAPALSEKRIANLQAYVRTTVRHEVISYFRQRKSLLSLAIGEDGELCEENIPLFQHQGMDDPQVEVEQQEEYMELLNQVVEATLGLPTVQRRAAICSLQEEIDDPSLLIEAFMKRNIDITTTVWPADRVDKQRLQASCSVARQTLARQLNIDISQYKQRRTASNSRSRVRKARMGSEMFTLAG